MTWSPLLLLLECSPLMLSTTAVCAPKYFNLTVGPTGYSAINKQLLLALNCNSITTAFLSEIGGFDTTLFPWGQENVELSIRVWLCGENGCLHTCLYLSALMNYPL